ncbi:MAG: double-strand break repair protein AddB [Propylenella sp.]
MHRSNVFTIPPGVPFLDALVGALLEGRLIAGFESREPFALADVTLYLPTRRSARAIRERFLAHFGRPVLLPKIRTLGDIDGDEAGLLDPIAAELPPAVPAIERQLVLTGLVLRWSGALVRAAADLPDEELLVPSSPADAARLAASLGQLIDQVGTRPEAWAGLFEQKHGDLARFWEITLEFLKIATEFWPAHLAERGMLDPGARRDLLIRTEAKRLRERGSAAPVVAAGSTGSVPATAELLAAIARLPNGAVVLPGLDQELDAESWEAIGADPRDPAGAGHPQFGLKQLLATLGVRRDAAVSLAEPTPSLASRERFVSESMRPAATTERWSGGPADLFSALDKDAALRGVGVIEAANEREEALAVATVLRRAVETPGKVAALVTPDRSLARRVAVELRRWAIDVDDSAGRPLARTPPGILARLVSQAGLNGAAAETLLALAKHPVAAFGMKRSDARRAARNLERAVLRGPRLKPGLAALRHALQERFAAWERRKEVDWLDRTNAASGLSRSRWEAAIDLAGRIESALGPLEAIAARDGAIPLPELVDAHLAALGAVARGASGRTTHVFSEEAGEALALAFEELQRSAPRGPAVAPAAYPGLFAALIERSMVRRRGGVDPRIQIWGALEARLQSVDMVVLGGLNEGNWPAQTRLDPLVSRPMREALDLEPPERRIGLAAHDFSQALGHGEVWLTRADREDGEPRVASRWLQRLMAYAGEDLAKTLHGRGSAVLQCARQLDRPAASDRSLRPHPSPPVAWRPKRLSATRIETLIRDPYAIYAEYVLKLKPFEPLAKLPDARDRGTLIHDILEDFVRERPSGPFDAAAAERLLAIGREAFGRHADFPEVIALWWPRFEKIAAWFLATEAARTDVAHRHVEGKGEMTVTPGFVLSARADRLDVLRGGGLAIIDYKTGTPPSMKEVRSLSPQLPLEGLIARSGGFDGIAAAEPQRILYYRLTGRGNGGEECDRTQSKRDGQLVTLADTLASTERRLAELVAHFAKPEAEYPSSKVPKPGRRYVGDYDHLARISEWVATDQEEDDERGG